MCVSALKLSACEQRALFAAAYECSGQLSLPQNFTALYDKVKIAAATEEFMRIDCAEKAFGRMLSCGFVLMRCSTEYVPVASDELDLIPEVQAVFHMSIELTVDGWVLLHMLAQQLSEP